MSFGTSAEAIVFIGPTWTSVFVAATDDAAPVTLAVADGVEAEGVCPAGLFSHARREESAKVERTMIRSFIGKLIIQTLRSGRCFRLTRAGESWPDTRPSSR